MVYSFIYGGYKAITKSSKRRRQRRIQSTVRLPDHPTPGSFEYSSVVFIARSNAEYDATPAAAAATAAAGNAPGTPLSLSGEMRQIPSATPHQPNAGFVPGTFAPPPGPSDSEGKDQAESPNVHFKLSNPSSDSTLPTVTHPSQVVRQHSDSSYCNHDACRNNSGGNRQQQQQQVMALRRGSSTMFRSEPLAPRPSIAPGALHHCVCLKTTEMSRFKVRSLAICNGYLLLFHDKNKTWNTLATKYTDSHREPINLNDAIVYISQRRRHAHHYVSPMLRARSSSVAGDSTDSGVDIVPAISARHGILDDIREDPTHATEEDDDATTGSGSGGLKENKENVIESAGDTAAGQSSSNQAPASAANRRVLWSSSVPSTSTATEYRDGSSVRVGAGGGAPAFRRPSIVPDMVMDEEMVRRVQALAPLTFVIEPRAQSHGHVINHTGSTNVARAESPEVQETEPSCWGSSGSSTNTSKPRTFPVLHIRPRTLAEGRELLKALSRHAEIQECLAHDDDAGELPDFGSTVSLNRASL